jgi:hypothetical protein
MIRCFCFRWKRNNGTPLKLQKDYREDAFRIRGLEKWATRFRAGQITAEVRLGKPPRTDFSDAVLPFLERQADASSRMMRKVLCSPKATVLRAGTVISGSNGTSKPRAA